MRPWTWEARAPRGEAGYVLVSVLWLLGVLGIAVAVMSVFTINSLSAIGGSADAVSCDALTHAGLESAVLEMLRAPPQKAVRGAGEWRFAQGRVRASWSGESGRVDLNKAPIVVLAAVVAHAAPDAGEAREIIRIFEARRGVLASQNSPPRPFRHVRELLGAGISPEVFSRLRTYLTVYSGLDRVDPRLARRSLLELLPDMSEVNVRDLEAIRDSDSLDIRTWGPRVGAAAKFLTTARSPATRIRLDTTLANGSHSATEVEITMFEHDSEPYRILSWEDRSGGEAVAFGDGDRE